MDTATRATLDDVANILERETGERYGDGYVVTDVVVGYAEPGYGSEDAVIVLGNWNPRRFPRVGEPELTPEENLGPRLAELLEEAGAELEWSDEWYRCEDCYRAFRSQADSYSWKMFGTIVNECEPVCANCLRADVSDYLDEYRNDPNNAVTWARPADMTAAGWVQWNPNGEPEQYEAGWHPGQDDDPRRILDSIREETEQDVVFLVNGVGQFDLRYSAWIEGEDA